MTGLITVTITAKNGSQYTTIWNTRAEAEKYAKENRDWIGATAVVREWIEVVNTETDKSDDNR